DPEDRTPSSVEEGDVALEIGRAIEPGGGRVRAKPGDDLVGRGVVDEPVVSDEEIDRVGVALGGVERVGAIASLEEEDLHPPASQPEGGEEGDHAAGAGGAHGPPGGAPGAAGAARAQRARATRRVPSAASLSEAAARK